MCSGFINSRPGREAVEECSLDLIFSSPEPKALSELIGWDSSWRPWVRVSVHTLRHEFL